MHGEGQPILDLIARVVSGDEAAWTEFLAVIGPPVERVVRARAPRDLVDDWQQEVLLRIFTRLGQYRALASIDHWASRVAVNTCLDLHRARIRQRRSSQVAYIDDEIGKRDQAATTELREVINLLLDRLDPIDREVVIMLDIEERSVDDIGRFLNRTESWVKVRAHRARKQLREWAERKGFLP